MSIPRKDRGYRFTAGTNPAAAAVDEYTKTKALAKLLEPEWGWARPDVAVVLGLLDDDGSLK